jgi:hypothetical protein
VKARVYQSQATKDKMAAAFLDTNSCLPTSLVAAKLIKYQDKNAKILKKIKY